jgi:orotate phosphoribosyltransferase
MIIRSRPVAEGPTMSDAKTELLQLLKERSFKEGTFRLVSGATSTYYIDGKMSEVFSRSARLIGEVLYEHTCDLGIQAIGGLEVGAVPLTAAAVIAYDLHGQTMEGFWVRTEVKRHGTQKRIEGSLQPGWRVAILDDVTTEGNSAMKAYREVRTAGCEIVVVLSLVDRLQGARELFAREGCGAFQSVFTIRDFGVKVDAPG